MVKDLVYVVMGNDFPAAVFDTAVAAEKYCTKKRKAGPCNEYTGGCRIHWRWYDFELNKG